MIANLFSIFDPSTSIRTRLNWASILVVIIFYPIVKWSLISRRVGLVYRLGRGFYSEVKPLLSSKGKITTIIFITLFIFILLINLIGLLPYIFTPTSHLVVTLRLVLPLWSGYFFYGWAVNIKWILAHLIPQGTPLLLIPFIVIIESVRRLIRPITLSVRLIANIIAGHLLLGLVRGAARVLLVGRFMVVIFSQILLVTLEVAVAMIQSYVLVVLRALYTSEV